MSSRFLSLQCLASGLEDPQPYSPPRPALPLYSQSSLEDGTGGSLGRLGAGLRSPGSSSTESGVVSGSDEPEYEEAGPGLGYNLRSEGVFQYRDEAGLKWCVHHSQGCTWRGAEGALGAHLATCR